MRSGWKLPPPPVELIYTPVEFIPIPAGSQTDMPLAKAGTVRNGANTPVITDLRTEKKTP